MNVYVTGIGEKSGKTVVSAGIAAVMQSLGYNAGVYKPVQTGADDKEKFLLSPDLAFVKMIDPYITAHSSFMYTTDAIPVVCAKAEKLSVSMDFISSDYMILNQKTDMLLVESPGGLMTPLQEETFAYDIPKRLDLPVVFVVKPGVGMLNAYLNELNTAQTLGLNISGVIINDFASYSDEPEIKYFPEMLEKYSDVKVLGLVKHIPETINANKLINEILNGVNIKDVLRMKIPKLDI